MKKVLVIGYGNILRGDDAAGVRAAELVAKRYPEIECICVHQLMPELAEQVAQYNTVVFIDAEVNAIKPNVRTVEFSDGSDQPRTHFLSPKSLLTLSQQLYQRVPTTVYAIGIPATEFEFSEQLSSSTARVVKEIMNLIESIIAEAK